MKPSRSERRRQPFVARDVWALRITFATSVILAVTLALVGSGWWAGVGVGLLGGPLGTVLALTGFQRKQLVGLAPPSDNSRTTRSEIG